MEMKFYRCSVCGQIVAIVKKKGCPIMCCGKPMEEIIPGTTDAAQEKHVPVYEVKDNIVNVTDPRTLYRVDLSADEIRQPA